MFCTPSINFLSFSEIHSNARMFCTLSIIFHTCNDISLTCDYTLLQMSHHLEKSCSVLLDRMLEESATRQGINVTESVFNTGKI